MISEHPIPTKTKISSKIIDWTIFIFLGEIDQSEKTQIAVSTQVAKNNYSHSLSTPHF
jgi:hypothetical protein